MPLDTTPGGAAAESLATVAQATAYHAGRGNAAWAAAAAPAKEQALRRATDFLGEVYASAWQGARASATQRLDWPRSDVVAYGVNVALDVIPPQVVDACCALALLALAGPLTPPATTQAARRVKVGPIEKEYAEGGAVTPQYIAVGRMLAPYLATRNRYAAPLERG